MSGQITQRELESYLWGAAIVLRGLIDAGDYKQYIFPLVFLKRISDVYDEEHAAALATYGDEELADLPENHRFAIPNGCHWDDVRSATENIGATILKAMRAIESANPDTLPGVFGDGDWGNKNLLPDSTLADLIEHFYCRKCFEAGRYAFSLMFTVTPDYDRAMREKDYIGVPDKHRKPALRRVK